ncbi:MAG: chemotaxis protein CheW [Planctomycetota bacterium]
MDDLIREFLVESYEGLDQLDRDLIALEKDPTDRNLLAAIFRCIHTIKGTCGFLAFHKLESVTHNGENLLSMLRDGKLQLNQEITTALLAMVDAVRQMLSSIENSGNEGVRDDSGLIALLTRLQDPSRQADPAVAEAVPAAPPEPVPPMVEKAERVRPAEAGAAPASSPPGEPAPEPSRPNESKAASLADTAVRVDVAQLDKLMNLVGELVLARNQILQFSANLNDNTFLATTQRLNLVTTELQGGVMKTRMQPIHTVWSRFPRVVRDLSRACGKKVRVEMEGEGTELDKTIIEAIKDPLTHVIRNSVDHGIEPPEVRRQKGKPEEGCLLLRAFHEGGQVNIEIIDDGAGINIERVKEKALQRSVITAEQHARMSDREAVNLIFRPGFSTAEKVTNVSGRGVGMDVVRTNIEKIGGTVDVQSVFGQGMTLRVKIPLTLAIIPALVVSTGGEQYAIPQVNLLELVRLEGDQARDGIEYVHRAPVYRLRGNILPLVFLDEELRIAKAADTPRTDSIVNIVVLQADDRQFGLVVEGINDTEEIVVKPLGRQLKGASAFAGATVRGDGKVALILDVMGLAQRAQVVTEHAERQVGRFEHADSKSVGRRQALLLFSLGGKEQMAMPLAAVARLEEIPFDRVELVGGQEVVQYRGEIMPLLNLPRLFNVTTEESERQVYQVIVHSRGSSSVGLVVGRILDIVDETIEVQRKIPRKGVTQTAVVHDRVTQFVDLDSIVSAFDPSLLQEVAHA